METVVYILLIAVLAGFVGALLGMGGAIIVTPALTLIYSISISGTPSARALYP